MVRQQLPNEIARLTKVSLWSSTLVDTPHYPVNPVHGINRYLGWTRKLARKKNHVERFNCTLRQRVSRLVRATLSFSKKLSNHIGAIR